MGSFLDFAFPAGDESDASGEEWDIGYSDKKDTCVKVTQNVHPFFNRFMKLELGKQWLSEMTIAAHR